MPRDFNKNDGEVLSKIKNTVWKIFAEHFSPVTERIFNSHNLKSLHVSDRASLCLLASVRRRSFPVILLNYYYYCVIFPRWACSVYSSSSSQVEESHLWLFICKSIKCHCARRLMNGLLLGLRSPVCSICLRRAHASSSDMCVGRTQSNSTSIPTHTQCFPMFRTVSKLSSLFITFENISVLNWLSWIELVAFL